MKDQLLKRSVDAAQRAIRHYLVPEYDQFLIQAGHSVELLGKARLASIHPSLIIDKDFDSFLHACGSSKHTQRPPWNIKTITATEVLKRCNQLHPRLRDFEKRLTLLAEYRNSAVHLGEIIEDEKKEIFHAFLAATSLLVDELGVNRREYFGQYANVVEIHLDDSLAETNRNVAERLARSRTVYAERYSALDSDQMDVVAKSVEARYRVAKYEDALLDCPACGRKGLLSGPYEVDWEVDYDTDGSISGGYPVVTMTASQFACFFCELGLSGAAELQAAGLPVTVDIEDPDPEDFYDPPDEYS
jgi:hypothetical protein